MFESGNLPTLTLSDSHGLGALSTYLRYNGLFNIISARTKLVMPVNQERSML